MIDFSCRCYHKDRTPIVKDLYIQDYAEALLADYRPELPKTPGQVDAFHFLEKDPREITSIRLADYLGISPTRLCDIEANRRCPTDMEKVGRFCEFFHLDARVRSRLYELAAEARYTMTGAVPNQDLNGNAGILFLSVCVVDKSAGNAVGHLVRVCGIDFFKHDFHPFLARSRRSMRSSCGDGSL